MLELLQFGIFCKVPRNRMQILATVTKNIFKSLHSPLSDLICIDLLQSTPMYPQLGEINSVITIWIQDHLFELAFNCGSVASTNLVHTFIVQRYLEKPLQHSFSSLLTACARWRRIVIHDHVTFLFKWPHFATVRPFSLSCFYISVLAISFIWMSPVCPLSLISNHNDLVFSQELTQMAF